MPEGDKSPTACLTFALEEASRGTSQLNGSQRVTLESGLLALKSCTISSRRLPPQFLLFSGVAARATAMRVRASAVVMQLTSDELRADSIKGRNTCLKSD